MSTSTPTTQNVQPTLLSLPMLEDIISSLTLSDARSFSLVSRKAHEASRPRIWRTVNLLLRPLPANSSGPHVPPQGSTISARADVQARMYRNLRNLLAIFTEPKTRHLAGYVHHFIVDVRINSSAFRYLLESLSMIAANITTLEVRANEPYVMRRVLDPSYTNFFGNIMYLNRRLIYLTSLHLEFDEGVPISNFIAIVEMMSAVVRLYLKILPLAPQFNDKLRVQPINPERTHDDNQPTPAPDITALCDLYFDLIDDIPSEITGLAKRAVELRRFGLFMQNPPHWTPPGTYYSKDQAKLLRVLTDMRHLEAMDWRACQLEQFCQILPRSGFPRLQTLKIIDYFMEIEFWRPEEISIPHLPTLHTLLVLPRSSNRQDFFPNGYWNDFISAPMSEPQQMPNDLRDRLLIDAHSLRAISIIPEQDAPFGKDEILYRPEFGASIIPASSGNSQVRMVFNSCSVPLPPLPFYRFLRTGTSIEQVLEASADPSREEGA